MNRLPATLAITGRDHATGEQVAPTLSDGALRVHIVNGDASAEQQAARAAAELQQQRAIAALVSEAVERGFSEHEQRITEIQNTLGARLTRVSQALHTDIDKLCALLTRLTDSIENSALTIVDRSSS